MANKDRTTKGRRLGRGLSSLIGDPVAIEGKKTRTHGGVKEVGEGHRPQATGDSGGDAPVALDEVGGTPSDLADSITSPAGAGEGAVAGDVVGQGGVRGGLEFIEVGRIVVSRFQPRTSFDEVALGRLADSIRRDGVMQPVLLRPGGGGEVDREGGGMFELVAGERRWRAAEMVGLERLPAIVVELSDEQAAEWGLVENLQREDLNAMERAWALRQMVERFALSHGEVAERVGVERSTVANLVRLTELEEPIQEMLADGRLTIGHGKILLSAMDRSRRVDLARAAAESGWSVRRLTQTIRQEAEAVLRGGPTPKARTDEGRDAVLGDLERRLGEHLGTKVAIHTDNSGKRGRMVVRFYDLDHFDGLMSKMGFNGRED